MKPENKQFLDDNRHFHEVYKRALIVRNMDGNTRLKMQQVIAEEFRPGYVSDLWCSPCVCEMVLLCYRLYDEWLAANPEPAKTEPPVPPVEPVKVAASFPQHKKHHRR